MSHVETITEAPRRRAGRQFFATLIAWIAAFAVVLVPEAASTIAVGEPALRATISASLHTLVVQPDGTLWSFGHSFNGQLGNDIDPSFDPNSTPTQVPGLSGVIAVATGDLHSLVLRSDGTVWAFGSNDSGQLGTTDGQGSGRGNPTPTQVLGLSDITAIAAGASHSLALRSDGTVWGFGRNLYGQLGTTTGETNPTPTQVPGLDDVIAIAAGGRHTLALRSDGTVWAFGANDFGQLGTTTNIGTSLPNPTPTKVPGLSCVMAISAGAGHSLVLRVDGYGTVWPFGNNQYGQLGTSTASGTNRPTPVPTRVPGLSDISALSAGNRHSLALQSDGTVWAFGDNASGELGTTTNNVPNVANPTPVLVPGLVDVTAIFGGVDDSLALRADGTILSFGLNLFGELGRTANEGTELPNPTSAQIPGLTGFVVPVPVPVPEPQPQPLPVPPAPDGSSFVASLPGRLLDSRVGMSTVDSGFAGIGRRAGGSVTELRVAGRHGVPVDASAVVLNVTVADAQGAGFVTVWPCGTAQPTASNLNFSVGQTIANAVTTGVGVDGKVCMFTSAATDLIADVGGYHPG